MLFARKRIIIFGCGSAGRRAFSDLRTRATVVGFSDNNTTLHGTRLFELPVHPPEALRTLRFDQIVIASMFYRAIQTQLTASLGLPTSRVSLAPEFAASEGGEGGKFVHWLRRRGWPADADDVDLWRLKNRHRGQRAFILGNGPSMQMRFLAHLSGEVTFVMNQFFRCFEQTSWRPDYYALTDRQVAQNFGAAIKQAHAGTILASTQLRDILGADQRIIYVRKTNEHYEQDEPAFSANVLWNVEGGYTTVYFCLQLGWFMGIRDFVLIGVDASYAFHGEQALGRDGVFERTSNLPAENWFLPDYFETGTVLLKPRVSQQLLAYQAARRFIEARGGRIRNAGFESPLEVFPRSAFDELFP